MGLAMAQQKQLIKYLFRDYHKELRPVKDESSGPTNVTVQLYFKQIQKVHENDQIITLYCWIEEYWQDEFLTWNPSDFGNIKSLHVPSEMIWKPDLLVYNNANMNIKENEMQTNVQIEHTGKISLFRAIITDITCDLQMEKFPYDQQICFIMLASWSYDGSQIMLNTAEQPTEAPLDIKNTTNLAILNHYIPNMEWKLVDFRYRNNLKYYDCCPNPYPDISYFFAIKRNPSYYLFTLIIPSAFITIVTVIGFFTPHSSTGENTEKVSLGVTALLSLAIILMMVSDKLPATSNSVPLLGQYYIGLIFIMFLATYCTTFTLGIQMQGNAGRPITRRLRSFLLSIRMNRNSFVQWFFGRELMNTQESIKMRLKKYDKLSELKKKFANGFVQFQQKLLKTDEPKHNKTASLIEQESIDSSKLLDPAMYNVVVDVLSSVQSIRQDLTSQEHLKRIRKEWQMLARMLEKIIMWIFIISTVAFASFMLYDTQDPPIITNEVMRSKST
nr:acetylcholine receptor, nicotinic, alpha 9 like (58.1 kD) alternative variant a [Caenorhabditis elegans]